MPSEALLSTLAVFGGHNAQPLPPGPWTATSIHLTLLLLHSRVVQGDGGVCARVPQSHHEQQLGLVVQRQPVAGRGGVRGKEAGDSREGGRGKGEGEGEGKAAS